MKKNIQHVLLVVITVSILPFLWLFTQTDTLGGDFVFTFANVCGFIGALLLFWNLVTGNRRLVKGLLKDAVACSRVIKLHISLGIYGAFFVLVHPLLELYVYVEGILFLFWPDFSSEIATHISFGRIAFILFLFIWITSALVREKIKYKPWLYIHYLSYLMMLFVFLHALDIGTYLESFPFIKGYWLLLMGIYAIFVLIRVGQIFFTVKDVAEDDAVYNIKKYFEI